jgi:hypothetical protein
MKMIVEKQMECGLAGETEVLGEHLPQRHFCPSQNATWPDPGLSPGLRGGKPETNCLNYGALWCLLQRHNLIFTKLQNLCIYFCILRPQTRSAWNATSSVSEQLDQVEPNGDITSEFLP